MNKIVVLCLVFLCAACGKPAGPKSEPLVTSQQVQQLQQVKEEPPAPVPAADTGAAPAAVADASTALTGEEVVLQDFEDGNGTKSHDVYFWDYGKAKPEIASADAFKGSQCLKTQGDLVGVNFRIRSADVSSYKKVFVTVFDTNGDNTLEIHLRDMKDQVHKVWSTEKSKKNAWQRVSIDLSQYQGKIDLTKVKNLEIYEWNPGIYRYDDIGVAK